MSNDLVRVTREEFVENQKLCCKENDAPWFMPGSGRCYHCGGDVIKELIGMGHNGGELVTSCPLCHNSYCE